MATGAHAPQRVARGSGKDVRWPAFKKLLGTSRRTTAQHRDGALDVRRAVDGMSTQPEAPRAMLQRRTLRAEAQPQPASPTKQRMAIILGGQIGLGGQKMSPT